MNLLDESFVIAICFTVLIYLIYRPVKQAILSSLDKQISDIKKSLEETRKLRDEAKCSLQKLEKELESFEDKKQKMLKEAKQSIKNNMDLKYKETKLLLKRAEDSVAKNLDHDVDVAAQKLRKEFISEVSDMVKTYLKETNNNQLSDQEIIANFISEDKREGGKK